MRRPSFVNFDKCRAPSGALVSQHLPECAPARIKDGLGYFRLGELGGVHVADDNEFVFTGDLDARDVELMSARVSDLGMDRADALLVAGPLGYCQFGFISPVMPECREFGSIAAHGQHLQSKINADLSGSRWPIIFNLAGKGSVPAPARILDECPGLAHAFDFPVLPQAQCMPEVTDTVAANFNGSRNVRNPAQGSPLAEAGSKSRAFLFGVAGGGKLSADQANGIGMQIKKLAASSAELYQIELTRPAGIPSSSPPLLGFSLCGDQKVPNLIAGDSQFFEPLSACTVFDSELVSNNRHSLILPNGGTLSSQP